MSEAAFAFFPPYSHRTHRGIRPSRHPRFPQDYGGCQGRLPLSFRAAGRPGGTAATTGAIEASSRSSPCLLRSSGTEVRSSPSQKKREGTGVNACRPHYASDPRTTLAFADLGDSDGDLRGRVWRKTSTFSSVRPSVRRSIRPGDVEPHTRSKLKESEVSRHGPKRTCD